MLLSGIKISGWRSFSTENTAEVNNLKKVNLNEDETLIERLAQIRDEISQEESVLFFQLVQWLMV